MFKHSKITRENNKKLKLKSNHTPKRNSTSTSTTSTTSIPNIPNRPIRNKIFKTPQCINSNQRRFNNHSTQYAKSVDNKSLDITTTHNTHSTLLCNDELIINTLKKSIGIVQNPFTRKIVIHKPFRLAMGQVLPYLEVEFLSISNHHEAYQYHQGLAQYQISMREQYKTILDKALVEVGGEIDHSVSVGSDENEQDHPTKLSQQIKAKKTTKLSYSSKGPISIPTTLIPSYNSTLNDKNNNRLINDIENQNGFEHEGKKTSSESLHHTMKIESSLRGIEKMKTLPLTLVFPSMSHSSNVTNPLHYTQFNSRIGRFDKNHPVDTGVLTNNQSAMNNMDNNNTSTTSKNQSEKTPPLSMQHISDHFGIPVQYSGESGWWNSFVRPSLKSPCHDSVFSDLSSHDTGINGNNNKTKTVINHNDSSNNNNTNNDSQTQFININNNKTSPNNAPASCSPEEWYPSDTKIAIDLDRTALLSLSPLGSTYGSSSPLSPDPIKILRYQKENGGLQKWDDDSKNIIEGKNNQSSKHSTENGKNNSSFKHSTENDNNNHYPKNRTHVQTNTSSPHLPHYSKTSHPDAIAYRGDFPIITPFDQATAAVWLLDALGVVEFHKNDSFDKKPVVSEVIPGIPTILTSELLEYSITHYHEYLKEMENSNAIDNTGHSTNNTIIDNTINSNTTIDNTSPPNNTMSKDSRPNNNDHNLQNNHLNHHTSPSTAPTALNPSATIRTLQTHPEGRYDPSPILNIGKRYHQPAVVDHFAYNNTLHNRNHTTNPNIDNQNHTPNYQHHENRKENNTLNNQNIKIPDTTPNPPPLQLHAVIGSSMGGQSALALTSLYPQLFARCAVICSTSRTTPHTQAIRSIQRRCITSDSLWDGGDFNSMVIPRNGLELSRMIGILNYRSIDEFNMKFQTTPMLPSELFGLNGAISEMNISSTSDNYTSNIGTNNANKINNHTINDYYKNDVEFYLQHIANKFVHFNPLCYVTLSKSMDLMDIAMVTGNWLESVKKMGSNMNLHNIHDDGTLSSCSRNNNNNNSNNDNNSNNTNNNTTTNHTKPKLQTEYLLLGIKEDELIPYTELKHLGQNLGRYASTHYETISSLYGHDAFLLDIKQFAPRLGAFTLPPPTHIQHGADESSLQEYSGISSLNRYLKSID